MNNTYDFIAIGLGPFNLGLACLSYKLPNLKCLFLEKSGGFDWHPGMMLQGVTLQTPFMADLVTMADPSHPLSFLNYLKKQGRLYSFYIRENFFIDREEYNHYCQWAVSRLETVKFEQNVVHIEYSEESQRYCIQTKHTQTGANMTYFAKKIVLGTGPVPYIPEHCQNKQWDNNIIHSTNYLSNKNNLQSRNSITIVGSGQSAAEIFYDLLQDIEKFQYQLNWMTRSPRFFPLDYSKLTLEMTSPEYVDYFYSLPSDKRDELIGSQKNLYKGINIELINDIFDRIYTKKLSYDLDVKLMTNCELVSITHREVLEMDFYHKEQERSLSLSSDALILATGYHYQPPVFIDSIRDRIQWDDKKRFRANRNYTIDKNGNEIFVQNAELHTHGFVTPDLGMACYRNSVILKEITGIEYFPIEKSIAFQTFGVDGITKDNL